MSLGENVGVASESIGFASLRSKGIITSAAAGNNGDTEYDYPASYSSVISVGAVDSKNQKASFSLWKSYTSLATQMEMNICKISLRVFASIARCQENYPTLHSYSTANGLNTRALCTREHNILIKNH